MSELTRWGESFELAPDGIPMMAWIRFAHSAKKGLDSSDPEAMDAMYTMLQVCFAPAAWDAFMDAAVKNRASGDDLFEVVTDALQSMASTRPTGRPSDSSDGSPTTSTNSGDGSSSRVIARFEEQGRPDLANMVYLADRSRRSA